MEHEFNIAIYFRKGDEHPLIDYQCVPAAPPFPRKLLVYCLHAVRVLVNIAHSPHSRLLANTLTDRKALHSLFVDDPYYQLRPFDGRTSKRRAVIHARISDAFTPYFNLKQKGFGFFGEGPILGFIRGIGLHFHYLFAQHKEESANVEMLIAASRLCGALALSGELGIRNQAQFPKGIAEMILQKNALAESSRLRGGIQQTIPGRPELLAKERRENEVARTLLGSALEHEKLAESIRSAHKLVGDYGAVLERNAHKDFKPETELPASKEEIKTAILLMAQYHKAAGTLDEKLYGLFEIGYTMLADFVPDGVAARANQPLDTLHDILSTSLAKGERAQLSDADILQVGSADMLLKSNLITEDQLKEAITRQSTSERTLGSNLVQLGHITENELARVLAEQHSVPLIDLADQDIDPSVVRFVPVEIAQKHTIFPIKRQENTLIVAMADPNVASKVYSDIHFLSGLNVETVVATESSIKDAIAGYYHPEEEGRPPSPESLAKDPREEEVAEILLRSKLISQDKLTEALSRQSISGGTLRSNLVQLGHLTEEELARFLAEQYSVPLIDLTDHSIDPSVIKFVPAVIAQKHTIIPIKRQGNVLTLAMADPGNVFTLGDIRFLSGFTVESVVATETSIKGAIARYYHYREK